MRLIFIMPIAVLIASTFHASAECSISQEAYYDNQILTLENEAANDQANVTPDESIGSFATNANIYRFIEKLKQERARICGKHQSAQLDYGAPLPSQDDLIQQWESTPEQDDLRAACANQLTWGAAIADAKKHGASLANLLRWAEKESEQSAALTPSEPLLPIGTDLILLKLIQRSYGDEPIYRHIHGGFAQWAYRSCLKGKSLGER